LSEEVARAGQRKGRRQRKGKAGKEAARQEKSSTCGSAEQLTKLDLIQHGLCYIRLKLSLQDVNLVGIEGCSEQGSDRRQAQDTVTSKLAVSTVLKRLLYSFWQRPSTVTNTK